MPRNPKLRTYDAACEELGGRPWLPKPDTDAWFLVDAAALTPPSLPGLPDAVVASLPDSGLYDLRKRMSATTKLCILAFAILVGIAAVAVSL